MSHFNIFNQRSFFISHAILLQRLDIYCCYRRECYFKDKKTKQKTSFHCIIQLTNEICLANKLNVLIKKSMAFDIIPEALALPTVDEICNPCKMEVLDAKHLSG